MAFEADLKMCDYTSLSDTSPEWSARFAQSVIYQEHGNNSNLRFEHICLDFQRKACIDPIDL